MAKAIKYQILNSKNPNYDEKKFCKMELLYSGGYQIMKHADLFLKKIAIEKEKSFQDRLNCAAYLPYLSQFIDYFSSFLFSDELLVKEPSDSDDTTTAGTAIEDQEFYQMFSINCDKQNNSFHNFMKDIFTESLYYPYSLVGVDSIQTPDNQPKNRAEEQAQGLDQLFLYYIDPKAMIDWKQLDNHKFQWVKLKSDIPVQDDPLKPPQHKINFKIWTLILNENKEFRARWEEYETAPMNLNKEPGDSQMVPLKSEGITDFREIPIFDLTIPCGLHIGEKLGPLCEEIFQRRSFLISNMNKSCVAVPVLKLGPEISAPNQATPSAVQEDPNRGFLVSQRYADQGLTVIGKDDEFDIIEAAGSSHALVDKQINDTIEKMHQLVNQMSQTVQANQKQVKSAQSKQEDRHATQIILSAYSKCVKDYVREIYDCISQARGEDPLWQIDGLNEFIEESRDVIIQEAVVTTQIARSIPSATFQKAYLKRQAHAILGDCNSEAQEIQIEQEIDEADLSQLNEPSNESDVPNEKVQ